MANTLEPNEREPVSANQAEPSVEQLWEEATASDNEQGSQDATPPHEDDANATDEGDKGNLDTQDPAQSDGKDVWQNVPDAARKEFERLQEENKRLAHSKASAYGRLKSTNRRLAELNSIIQSPAVRRDEQNADPLATLEEQYPEVAAPIRQAVKQIDSKFDAIQQAERQRVQAATVEQQELLQEQRQLLAEQTAIVREQEADGWDLVSKNVDYFKQWAEDQPKRIRDAVARNGDIVTDAQETIDVIRAFKQHVATLERPQQAQAPAPQNTLNDKRARQLAATSTPTRSNRQPVISGLPDNASPEDYWNALVQEDEQKKRRY